MELIVEKRPVEILFASIFTNQTGAYPRRSNARRRSYQAAAGGRLGLCSQPRQLWLVMK
jgi:hypothetical protein